VLLDDAEKMKAEDCILRSIYDAGWEPGAHRLITDKGEPTEIMLHAPMAVGATDELVRKLKTTSLSRSIRFRMPQIRELEKDLSVLDAIRQLHILPWIGTVTLDLNPPMPKELELLGREADTWRPIFTIAEVCGWSEEAGKSWLDLVAKAALDWLAEEKKSRRRPDEVMIVIHMLQIFDALGVAHLGSEKFVKLLRDWLEADGRWIKLTVNKLANILRESYAIVPDRLPRARGEEQPRGYRLSQFEHLRVLGNMSDEEIEPYLKLIHVGEGHGEGRVG